MGLKSAIRGQAETFAIGYLIRNIESGRYGEALKGFWFSLKGKKTIIGFALFAIGGAIAAFPDPSLLAFGGAVAITGQYLARFGLMSKGSDKLPPVAFPEEYRDEAQLALSGATYLMEILTAGGGLMMLSSNEHISAAAVSVLTLGGALSTATGYFSTLIGPTPTQAANVAVVAAVTAVLDARTELGKVADIATDIKETGVSIPTEKEK